METWISQSLQLTLFVSFSTASGMPAVYKCMRLDCKALVPALLLLQIATCPNTLLAQGYPNALYFISQANIFASIKPSEMQSQPSLTDGAFSSCVLLFFCWTPLPSFYRLKHDLPILGHMYQRHPYTSVTKLPSVVLLSSFPAIASLLCLTEWIIKWALAQVHFPCL